MSKPSDPKSGEITNPTEREMRPGQLQYAIHANRIRRTLAHDPDLEVYDGRTYKEQTDMITRDHAANYRKCRELSPEHICVQGSEVWGQLRKFPANLQTAVVQACFGHGHWNFCTALDVVTQVRIMLDGGMTPAEALREIKSREPRQLPPV